MAQNNITFERNIDNAPNVIPSNQALDSVLNFAKQDVVPDVSLRESLTNKIRTNFKHVLNFIVVIIMVITVSLSSFKKAEAGMLLGDHRYTSGAVAADMSQCAMLIAL